MKRKLITLVGAVFVGSVTAQTTSNSVLQQAEALLQQKQAQYELQIENIRKENPLYVYAEEHAVLAEDQYQALRGQLAVFREEIKKATDENNKVKSIGSRLTILINQLALSEVLENEKAREAYKDMLGRLDPYKRAEFLEMILADSLRLPSPEELKTTDYEQQWSVFVRTKQDRKKLYESEIEVCRKALDIPQKSIELTIKYAVASYLREWIWEPYVRANTPPETVALQSEIKKLKREVRRLKFEEQKPKDAPKKEDTPKKVELSADVKKQIATISLKIETLEEKQVALRKREEAACLEIYNADPEQKMVYEKNILTRRKFEEQREAYEEYKASMKDRKLSYGGGYGALVDSVVLFDLYKDPEIKKYQTYLFQVSPSVKSMKRWMEKNLADSLQTFSNNRDQIIEIYFKRLASVQETHQKRILEIEEQYKIPKEASSYVHDIARSYLKSQIYSAYLSRYLYRHLNEEVRGIRDENSECTRELKQLKNELSSLESAR